MQNKTVFNHLPERPNFPQSEEETYQFWEKIDAFKQQLELTKDFKKYTFYDGPPFATGLPHYGHICAGTIKDVICRYFSQTGFHVERRFGWDCHGLPVEYEIDKMLGIKHKNDVLNMGIDKYNQECRQIVQRYSKEWRQIIGRTGRWIDFDNDYKTLDARFMESVWWVFKQIWQKGLVYRGCKVMPYSNACNTVLSNFETQLNYKEVLDPSLYVTFPWVNDPDTKFVAWTTTPWTLPSNLALVVNPDFIYVKVWDKEHKTNFVIAECRMQDLYPANRGKDSYEIKQKYKGSELLGQEYIPLFNYYENRKQDGCFKVLVDSYVTNDTGTGVVHAAPGFGVDDYKVCLKAGIIRPDNPPVPIDDNGRFYDNIIDFKGMYVKDADKEVRKILRQNGRLLIDSQLRHNYPFCWRSETPLIYKAVHTWFIKVTQIKEDLIKNNKKSYWVPQFAQEGRFNNWLENAEDWCFSRNRFWGNPIPIWVSDDYEEAICIGSIEELEKLSGITGINDIHREFIDQITIPSQQGKGKLRRIEEIFDCWFESGSMPYAQQHYPFSMNEEQFKQIFPADFIAEGIDQTRGWFYTLNVIATALRNDTPYKNLIVNGLVLNSEGKKMSKSKRNYPDPMEVINNYGADAMRLYLINSPLVKAENLNFNEQGVKGIVRDVFLPWYNAYRFLLQNISRYEGDSGKQFIFNENISLSGNLSNITDKWIIATEQNLIQKVRHEMENYRLYTVVPELLGFLENLTNWYVRLNRYRLKGEHTLDDQLISLNVLFDVLFKLTVLLSPYVPFITENFYQNLKKCITSQNYSADSIHFLQIPQYNSKLIDEKIEQDVKNMQDVIIKARKIRETNNISLKQPISSLTIITTKESLFQSLAPMQAYIEEEVNVNKLIFESNVKQFIELKAEPDNTVCGKELGEKFNKDFINRIRNLSQDEIRILQSQNTFTMDVIIQREIKQQQQSSQDNNELQEESKDDSNNNNNNKKKNNKKATKQKKQFEEIKDTVTFTTRHVLIKERYKTENLPKHLILSVENDYSLLMDSTQDEKLKKKGLAREFINRIQKTRKNLKLQIEDDILIFYQVDNQSSYLQIAINEEFKSIINQVKKPILLQKYLHPSIAILKNAQQTFQIDDFSFTLWVVQNRTPLFDDEKLNSDFGPKLTNIIKRSLGTFDLQNLRNLITDGVFTGVFDGTHIQLKENHHIFLEAAKLVQA